MMVRFGFKLSGVRFARASSSSAIWPEMGSSAPFAAIVMIARTIHW
jgi:hypothetical protein